VFHPVRLLREPKEGTEALKFLLAGDRTVDPAVSKVTERLHIELVQIAGTVLSGEGLELLQESSVLLETLRAQFPRVSVFEKSLRGVGDRDRTLVHDAEFPVADAILASFPGREIERPSDLFTVEGALNMERTLAIPMEASLVPMGAVLKVSAEEREHTESVPC
jgi:hypothetical protein